MPAENEETSTARASTSTQPENTAPQSPPSPAEVPRQEVNVEAIVNERLASEKARLDQVLQKLGAPGLDGVDTWMQEREQKRAQELAEKGRYQELYESERKARAELQHQMEKTREEALHRTRESAIDRALLEAAAKSVAPKQVSALLRKRVKYDDVTAQVYVVDDQGHRITDGRGGYLDVPGLITQFLADNPHFAPAAPGRGAASTPAPDHVSGTTSASSEAYDATRLTDAAYRQRAIEAVRRSLRR